MQAICKNRVITNMLPGRFWVQLSKKNADFQNTGFEEGNNIEIKKISVMINFYEKNISQLSNRAKYIQRSKLYQ